MASSALAATGLIASQSAIVQQQQQQALLDFSSSSPPTTKSAAPITRVAIRDGKTIGINDHIYLSPAWAPGAGEPYMIARVMEFVTAASSRSGAAALVSSSGTLQVRANLFLRMRDISLKSSNDPRLLVATMHSDVFSLENIRGICEVRHRDLISQGKAPEVSQWKKKEDHFYYHQLYDRYIHRFYDVIPTDKIKNAPLDVLETLRTRYSFVAAEAGTGMITDLTDALRGCTVCRQWAPSPESVRCDTCKKYFHMKCLNPPLVSKPAKGYSWTCAPCSKRHEQNVESTMQAGGQLSGSSDSSSSRSQITQTSVRGLPGNRGRGAPAARGRGRPLGSGRPHSNSIQEPASAMNSPDGSPMPDRTVDDLRGTRCFNRWPYRYFGQHTNAKDVLDSHDSVYPIATTRLGPKYQASLPTWEEQQEVGIGTHIKSSDKVKEEDGQALATAVPAETMSAAALLLKKKGRPFKRKRDNNDRSDTPATTGTTTPTLLASPMSSEDPEFERGTEHSAEPISLPSILEPESVIDSFIQNAQAQCKNIEPYNLDLLDRALQVFTDKQGDPATALTALAQSSQDELRVVNWSAKETKQFDVGITAVNSDMRQLKTYIPTKKVGDIVRYFVLWKIQRIKAESQPQKEESSALGKQMKTKQDGDSSAASSKPSTSRAVSPSLSIYGDSEPEGPPPITCAMCSAVASPVWYKGPASLSKRVLCVSCGLYWRKYAAEPYNTDLVSVNTRNKTSSAEDGILGVAPPSKMAKLSKDGKTVLPANGASALPPVPRLEPIKCVMCKRIEPKRKLAQCRNCSLSVHQGCYGLTDEEIEMENWTCDPCDNETTLEAALLPRCILCSPSAQEDAAAIAAKHAPLVTAAPAEKGRGRPKKDANGGSAASTARSAPLSALDAFKPTECNNWAHVLCSVWMPGVIFSDIFKLKLIESCGNLATWRYEAECAVCHDRRGACVTCSEPSCRKTFHVSCAYNQQPGFTLAFEIIPVKGSRREVIPTLTFKGETGHMMPQIWCKDHKEIAKTKKLYDLAEVDPKTSLTSLQMFVRTNKHLATTPATTNTLVGETTYALLRRAKRYDSLLSTPTTLYHPLTKRSPSANISTTSHGKGDSTVKPVAKHCSNCNSHFSPFWWRLPSVHHTIKTENDETTQSMFCCNYCKETTFKSLDIQ